MTLRDKLVAAIDAVLAEESGHTMDNPAAFFAGVRVETNGLTQEQVDTVNALLKAASHWSAPWLAYGLATAWHEARFLPQEEWGKGKGRYYGVPGKYDQIPYGRGLIQVTLDRNYEWLDEQAAKAGLTKRGEILADFSLALRPDIAVFALVKGMEDGAYTGKGLSDYITTGTRQEFVNARRIVNGTDKANLIAGHAVAFLKAIHSGGW